MLVKADHTLGSQEQGIAAKLQRMPAKKPDPKARERAEFAERLEQFMHSKGWNSTALDRASGIAKKTIDRILGQETTPNPNTVKALAEAFGVSPEELLGRQPPPSVGPAAGVEQVDAGFQLVNDHIDAVALQLAENQELLRALLEKLAPAEFANAMERLAGHSARDGERPAKPAQTQPGQDSTGSR